MDPLIEPAWGNVTTARLRLRGWEHADEQQLLELSTDPEVMRHFPRPMTGAEVRAFIDRQRALHAAGRPALLAVETLHEGRFIGFVGLAEPRFEAAFTPCVEIGWRLARDAWGQGYATEAAGAVLTHAFTALGLAEVVSFTTVTNERSQAVMRRLGMHTDRAEDFDHPSVEEGSPLRRHVLYRLRAEQWLDWSP